MQRLPILLALAIAALVLAGCGAFGSDGGGEGSSGGDDGDASAEELQLESLLRPIFGFDPDQELNVFLDRLPASFPDDFPVPSGAMPVTAIDGPAAGILLVAFDTPDSAEELITFYESELDEVTAVSRGEQNIVRFNSTGGGTGQVIVDQFQRGSDDNSLILLFQNEPQAAADEAEGTFEPDESLELPEGFPEDRVPLYPESTVIQVDSGEQQGFEQFGATTVSGDDFEPIIEFYEEELEANGWEVADTVDDGNQVQIQFTDPDDPNLAGLVLITVFTQDRLLTSIQIQINAPLDADQGEG